jgi:hypothetical protein
MAAGERAARGSARHDRHARGGTMTAGRNPPEIVMTPLATQVSVWYLVLPFAMMSPLVVLAFVFPDMLLEDMAMPFAMMAVYTIALVVWQDRRSRIAERKFFERYPEARHDVRVELLRNVWRGTRSPRVARVQKTALQRSDRALIMLCGLDEMPEKGPEHFEPEIITALEARWESLLLLPAVLVGVVAIVLDRLWMLPSWFADWMPLCYGAVAGYALSIVGAVVVLGWRSGIRPAYIRVAPGMVQFLTYPLGASKPRIRSYPMDAGTVVLILRMGRMDILSIIRGKQQDQIRFREMRRGKERFKVVWQALTSTAPTPPLSDTELVG